MHHEYHDPVAFAAEHTHPLESLLGNHIPFFAGPIVTGAAFPVVVVWVCVDDMIVV